MPPTVDQNIYKPVTVRRLANEYGGPVWVYDLGANIGGTCSVKVNAFSAPAATMKLRHGEMLLHNGSLNLNYSGHDTGVKAQFQEDTHMLRPSPAATTTVRSAFVWYGFQYISVEASEEDLFTGALDALEHLGKS